MLIVKTEMTGEIEQLKTENESLSSIGITSVVQDSDAERTNFDIQITSDQIDTIASEAEPDDSSASESCSAANKSIFSKKTYCATAGQEKYKTIQCPNGKLVYEHKQFKARLYVIAMAKAIWYYGSGVSLKKGGCNAYCK